jgi:regulatory protein
LRWLTGRAHSRGELEAKLRRTGVPEHAVTSVLDRYEDVGLIDDVTFAAAWVDTRQRTRSLARSALARELRQRGVDDTTVAGALARIEPDDELETARALVHRRLPATARLAPEVRARRLVAMLARKGYPAGAAYRVVAEALKTSDLVISDQNVQI